MGREFWAVRRPGWVVVGLVIAIVAITIWLLQAKSGANAATVLALPISVVSLAVAVRGLWPYPPLSRVARELADRIAQERGSARRQALGMSGDARPANVTLRSPLPDDEPELVRWRSDGGAEYRSLRDVANFYQSLDRGRMVVLGEPGAGKTVLASQLVIDLIEKLPDGELQPGARPPVPVWLSLTSLDLGQTDLLPRSSAEEIAILLDEWIAVQISGIYQVPRSAAERLIRERWVLPVLDGLDEMDAPSQDAGLPTRPRAAAVVRALNAGTGRRPVVLVCRRGEYGQLACSASSEGEDPVLQDASQIVLQPLDVPSISDYLTRRFPGERPGSLAVRWKNVQAALEATTTLGRADSLADVLSSPWRLFLATTAYQDDKSDPDELIRCPIDKLGDHLLGQLIPAVTRRTPRLDGRRYSPEDVRSWLSHLAGHLQETSSDPQLHWSPTDLRLERLWSMADQKAVRWLSSLTVIALLGAAFAIPGLIWVSGHGRWYPDTVGSWLGLILNVAVVISIGIFLNAYTNPTLRRLDLRVASPTKRKKLVFWLAIGLVIGLALGLGAGLQPTLGVPGPGVEGGLLFGLVVGLAAGSIAGLTTSFSLAAQPSSIMRQNITYALAIMLLGGLAYGLGYGLSYGPVYGRTVGLESGLTSGLGFGLATGLTVGLTLGLAVWIRYVIGCWLARRNGMLPRRVGNFLDWAYRANLLRMSGTAAQFRHRELQDWLTRQPKIHLAKRARSDHGNLERQPYIHDTDRPL
jgi:hypothetical protein